MPGGAEWNLELGVLMPMIVERGGTRIPLTLVLPPEPAEYWLSRTGLTLLLFRVAQIVSLAAGLVIAWRRPRDPIALSAAWFLLTCTVFVIALPFRLFTVWRDLPIGIRELFWLPYASGLAIGPILLTFVTLFPRRIAHAGLIQGLTWTVACAAAAAPLSNAAHLLYWGTELRTVGPRSLPLLVVTSVSLLAAVALALVHYRQVRDVTERRRLRVVVAGIVVAALPGYWAIVYRWLPGRTNQSESVFASPIMAVAAVALLAAPLSLTYAVLRHRLFDVSFIVRTALQYTLARWTVLSLVPAISLFMILETLRLRNLTVNAVLARRGALFLLLTLIAFVVFAYRRRWLRAIDRRFFRERHYAYSVLREVAVEVGRAGSLASAAPLVVARIEAAMHPEFVALLVRDLPSRTFKTTAATPSGSAPPDLPEDSKLVAMAFVHSHPLNTSEDGDEAVLRDLSPSDLTYVRRAHIEVVIRVATQDEHPHALLVLGPKRSEEPYANEDYDVLVTIAENLALLVGRVAPQRESPSLEECPECGTCFDGGTRVCKSHDRPLSRRSLPRRLADRYRFDRRIAAGGMGTVYEAFDTALEKPVAAKVVHENLASTDGILSRFNEEAKIAASLRGHPNVVTVYDYGLVDGHQPFIIMELLDGLTLRHLLQATHTLDPGRALDVLSGVCSAVSAAHHLGLIHRDLKPENIFLTEVHGTAKPKVIDFGIARPLTFVTTATYRRNTGSQQPGRHARVPCRRSSIAARSRRKPGISGASPSSLWRC